MAVLYSENVFPYTAWCESHNPPEREIQEPDISKISNLSVVIRPNSYRGCPTLGRIINIISHLSDISHSYRTFTIRIWDDLDYREINGHDRLVGELHSSPEFLAKLVELKVLEKMTIQFLLYDEQIDQDFGDLITELACLKNWAVTSKEREGGWLFYDGTKYVWTWILQPESSTALKRFQTPSGSKIMAESQVMDLDSST